MLIRMCNAAVCAMLSAAKDKAEPIEAATLAAVDGTELDREADWLANIIQTWLDEEWQVQKNHADVGAACAQAYRNARSDGEDDIGTILLSIGSELQSFDFSNTFTGAFDVANKAIEMLMMAKGDEVCCTSADDKRRVMEQSLHSNHY